MWHQNSSNYLLELETICRTLADVLQSSFGPRTRNTCILSNTGHVLLTCDGSSILSFLDISHPFGRSIVNNLNSFISQYGDGSKSLALYLSALSHAVRNEAECFSQSRTVESSTFTRAYFSRSLLSFLNVDLPFVITGMTCELDRKMREELRSLEPNSILSRVMKTVLKESQHAMILTKIVGDYLSNSNEIQTLCQWFDNSVFLIPFQHYPLSCVMDGICLTSSLYPCNNTLRDVSFVCLMCPLDCTASSTGDISDIIQLTSSGELLSYSHFAVTRFLSSIKKEISLIITSSKASDAFLQICQDFDIAVIDCVEEEVIQWICDICRKSPVTTMQDEIGSNNTLKAVSCEKIAIAQKSFINIILGKPLCHPKSVFLAAPCPGECDKLKVAVKKCISVARQLFNNSGTATGKELDSNAASINLMSNVVPGGGYFEMLLSDHLCNYQETKANPEIEMCCSLLQRMLLAVPRVLNGHHSILPGRFRFSVSSQKEKPTSCEYLSSISDDALEVLSIKVASVYMVVNLMISFLRIDKIIGVKSCGKSTEECKMDNG